MKSSNALLLVLLLAIAGGGVYFAFFASGPEARPGPLTPQQRADSPADDASERAGETRTVDSGERQAAERTPDPNGGRVEVAQNDGTDYAQGIAGRLVDDSGRPVAGAEVFLFEGYGNNPFLMMMEAGQGVVKPPLARGESAEDGSFRLGLRRVEEGKTYELRAISTTHADVTRPNLTLYDGKWFDAGELTMKRGLVVHGRVADEASGAPIAGASVYLKSTMAQMTTTPTPGRERGIETVTDERGNYRFANADRGNYSIAAVTAGYAQVEKTNINVAPDADNRVDFELPVGKSLSGVVSDADGQPIEGARVQGSAISSKSPLTVVERTDEAGRFELIGLVDSPFQLQVSAPGYVNTRVDAVPAGTTDEHIVLEEQCSVRLKVISERGRRINSFRAWVKNWLPAQEQIGNLPGVPAHRVSGRDLDSDGYYELTGLNPGSYKLEVHARGFAKNFSEPIELQTGQEPPQVEVRLGEGGEITGVVTGQAGEPLADVVVKTLPNSYEDNAIAAMFGALIPYEISRAQTKTDGKGRFRLQQLHPGEYQLQLNHPQHYAMFEKGVVVQEGTTTEVGPLRMQRGTLLYGTVRLDGAPAPQIKVMVNAKPDPESSGSSFSAQAVSNEEGQWVMPKRLPPGEYTAQAGRQGGPQDIFNMVLDYQRTKKEFQVGPGNDQYEIHFQIQSDPAPLPNQNRSGGNRDG